MTGPAKLRCAVYTRKSTEEGLDQEFNSLDAQRESCEAFIASQASLGWKLVPDHYDDGGISGGTMQRPALQRLLQDIRDRKVDVVVVYKIDRLTRSLTDFSKIVDVFDGHGVSFVSVTQQFNTTTSMGRLTLNVLLSFAQFEREVAAERIRDKVAASRKKGMWMGGSIPTGYRVENKKLIPEPAAAEIVRAVFQRYLELGSVPALARELSAQRPTITDAEGRLIVWSKGKLYGMLSNQTYVGKVRHKKDIYQGEHQAILAQYVFDQAQALLAGHAPTRAMPTNVAGDHLLGGVLFDEAGTRLRPVSTTNHGRRYRYYVDATIRNDQSETTASAWRLPADRLERAVLDGLRNTLASPSKVASLLHSKDLAPDQLDRAVHRSKDLAVTGDSQSARTFEQLMRPLIHRATLRSRRIMLAIRTDRLTAMLLGDFGRATQRDIQEDKDVLEENLSELVIAMDIRRRGVEARIVLETGDGAKPDPVLVDLIGRAHFLLRKLTGGSGQSMAALASETGIHIADVSRLLPLAFLSPKLTDAILTSRQPAELTGRRLARADDLPLLWSAQLQAISAA